MKWLPRPLAHLKGYWTAYVVLGVSLFLTVAGYLGHANYIDTKERARFSQASRMAIEQTRARLSVYLALMKGVRAFLAGSESVDANELSSFFQALKLSELERNSGMEGLGVVWKVPMHQRAAHEAEWRKTYPAYRISSGKADGVFYPIVHFEPAGPSFREALGWDASQDIVRRAALEAAENSGTPASTAKTHLIFTDTSPDRYGFVVYLPIIAQATDANSPPTLLGHVFATFDSKKFFQKLFPKENEIVLMETYDGPVSKKNLLFDEDSVFHPDLTYSPAFENEIRAEIFGRFWTFHFHSHTQFESSFERRLPAFMLAFGTLGSLLFFCFVFAQISARKTAETLSEHLGNSERALKKANIDLALKVQESKRNSEALAESLSLQLATLDSTADGILVVDTAGKIVSYNRQFLDMWRVPAGSVMPKKENDAIDLMRRVSDQLENADEFLDRFQPSQWQLEGEISETILFRDGRIFERHCRPQKVEGTLIGRVMSFRDVTEQKKAAEKIAAEKDRLAVTLKAINDGVVATDIEGRIVLMNPVAEEMAGVGQCAVFGISISEVFPLHDSESKEKLPIQLEAGSSGGNLHSIKPVLLINATGGENLVCYRGAPTRDSNGDRTGTVFVFRDVSQEQKAEQEQLRASKLESIGLLAGGIAHDFNNVLTGIVGNLSLLREHPGLSLEVSERLGLLEKSAYKARQLTMQLLTFAKGGSPIKQTASVVEVIKDSTEFALRGANLKAEFNFPLNLAAVEIDTGQIGQVIQNLVINAKQAMPNGGDLRVSAQNVTVSGRENLPLARGDYICVSIEDSGCGISQEHIGKIFDPYFTTKEKGTGLGLATAYSILKRHDGLITVQSEPSKGSTFHLYLPVSKLRETSNAGTGDTTIQLRESGSGRILAMDDDPGIRTLLDAVLKHFGYDITTVPDGAEAIREYTDARESGQHYSAVIMDLTIPGGMGGKETIKVLREIDPGVKAIVCSGYSNDPVLAEYQKYGFVARVEKPYRMQELGRVLKTVLTECE